MRPYSKKTIAVLQLLIIIWALFSVVYFSHTHTDMYGRLVMHSHPFETGRENQSPRHSHSQKEFEYLGAVYEAFSAFMLVLLVVSVFLQANRKPDVVSSVNNPQPVPPARSDRAPPFSPVFLQFC